MTRKPYSGAGGAYSAPPNLCRRDDGRWYSRGQIDQWIASLDDLCAATELAMEGEGERSAQISVALHSGTSQRYASSNEFRDALEELDPRDVATVRVAAKIADQIDAVILVRNQIPAVLVEVAGPDGATVLGLAQLLHDRLMSGYVDPLTSLRGFVGRFSSRGLFLTALPGAAVELSPTSPNTRTPRSTPAESVHSARSPTAAVLWAHGDPEWQAHEEEAWQNTVQAFTLLLRANGINADLDLFHGHTATDWARFGPRAIRNSDYVLIAVSPTWRRAWDGEIEPGKSAGALGEANALHGLFKENYQKFLERVIPVLLPTRGESDLPTGLKATSHWVRECRRWTNKASRTSTGDSRASLPIRNHPSGRSLRTLPPRTLSTPAAEVQAPETEERTDSKVDIEHEIDRAESALADMPPASPGAGEEPWDQARHSVEAQRQALLRELRQLDSGQHQHSILEEAARSLVQTEACMREAWRVLLNLDIRSDSQLDDILRTEHFDFPQTRSTLAEEAAQRVAEHVEKLREVAARLVLRLDEAEPAVQAFFAARDHLAAVATTMVFAAQGVIGPGGDDPEVTIDEFFKACDAQRDFYREARRILS